MLFPSFFNASKPTYEIEQSLRFRGNNTYFTKTFGSSGDRRKFTLSVWVKKATTVAVSPNNTGLNFFGSNSGSVGDSMNVGMNSDTTAIQFYQYNSGYAGGIFSDARYRDPSAWMHVVFVWDSAQATASDRMAVYVNNRVERPDGSAGSPDTAPSQNKDAAWNYSSYTHTIGGTNQTNDMYLAEAYHIDGQALDPTSFGEYDDNGVWRPIEYTGTYTGNSFYLKFDPSATNGIGHDHSGLGNNWSPTGFTTSGTGTDVMSDTPTTNWCTLNPLEKPGGTAPVYENGNLTLRNSTNYFFAHGVGTFGLKSGKWYFETSGDTSIYVQIGFVDSSQITSMTGGGGISGANISWHYQSNGIIRGLSSTYQDTGLTAASTAGDIMGLAIDFDAGEASWYVNGTQVGSTVDFSSYLSNSRIWYPVVAVTNEGTDVTNVNFGQRDFAYTPPTGFKAWNTSNLSAPTVKDGSEYFNTVTYTGTGASNARTDVGFQPDFLWIKSRSNTHYHVLVDAVRNNGGSGSFLELFSNATASEQQYTGRVTSLDSTGFTVGTDSQAGVNTLNNTYVAWNWLAGNGTSSNTDGSITSTVSANPSAGFSIVSYSGSKTSAGSDTVGHGLNVAPSLIIVKRRNSAYGWSVAHASLGFGSSNILALDSTDSAGAYSWDDFGAAPTSDVFTVSYSNRTNISGGTHIAYCFAEVEGYSKFGSYTGNGSPDGPFIHLGFRPRFIMIKAVTSVLSGYDTWRGWYMVDTARYPFNGSTENQLWANRDVAEGYRGGVGTGQADLGFDILSNGFKLKRSSSYAVEINYTNTTHIYCAFAENPFGGSGVSPATAR